jgi:hypothetical protein
VLNGVSSRRAAVPDAEFVKNRAQVRVDRTAAKEERVGDLGIRHPACHQTQHLDLPLGQLIEPGSQSGLRLGRLGRYFRGRFTPGGQNSTPCASNRTASGEASYYVLSLQSVAVDDRGCIGKSAYLVGAKPLAATVRIRLVSSLLA